MRILLTGVNGQLGYELKRSLAMLGEVIATDRQSLDLARPELIGQQVADIKPDLIVNAAAYTAVDKAEEEPELAKKINADAPAELAKQAKKRNIPLIHYSTDYVFNGEHTSPWLEDEPPAPLNVYGSSKLAGEQAIADIADDYLIFRTGWVYGARGNNFLRTMVRLADREKLSVVDDQIGAPTWCRHIADASAQIIAEAMQNKLFWDQHSGLFHLSAAGQTSWYHFAKAIFAHCSNLGKSVPELEAIASAAYPTPAPRPLFSCLSNEKLKAHFKLALPDWEKSLAMVISDINQP